MQIKGFGRREGEGRENGASVVLIDFPDAVKTSVGFDPETRRITRAEVPNPHQEALSLDDLRNRQKLCPAESENYHFFKEAETSLLHHIETTQQGPEARTESRPAPTLPLSPGR